MRERASRIQLFNRAPCQSYCCCLLFNYVGVAVYFEFKCVGLLVLSFEALMFWFMYRNSAVAVRTYCFYR